MELKKGTVVRSTAGRDKGKFLVVLELGEKFVTVADGKERPLARPKRKNPKHLQGTQVTLSLEQITDKKLRTALKADKLSAELAEEGDIACQKQT